MFPLFNFLQQQRKNFSYICFSKLINPALVFVLFFYWPSLQPLCGLSPSIQSHWAGAGMSTKNRPIPPASMACWRLIPMMIMPDYSWLKWETTQRHLFLYACSLFVGFLNEVIVPVVIRFNSDLTVCKSKSLTWQANSLFSSFGSHLTRGNGSWFLLSDY